MRLFPRVALRCVAALWFAILAQLANADQDYPWAVPPNDPVSASADESGIGYVSLASGMFLDEEDAGPALDDFEVRLKSLESAWAEQQASLEESEKAARSKPTFKINGRIHLDHWNYPEASTGIGFFEHPNPAAANYGDDPEDSFLFRRIRLEMSGDILETMLWRIQVDFNNPNDPELKDVYLGFKELPANQQLLIGIQKRPIGLDHLNSSRYNVFLERPFVVETFNEDARRLGVAMYGHNDEESFIWTYGVFNAENITSSDGRYFGDSYQLSFNARIAGSPWYDEASDGRGYFHWALATMVQRTDGNNPPGATNSNEARFRTRPEARTINRWLDRCRSSASSSTIGCSATTRRPAQDRTWPFTAATSTCHTSSRASTFRMTGAQARSAALSPLRTSSLSTDVAEAPATAGGLGTLRCAIRIST